MLLAKVRQANGVVQNPVSSIIIGVGPTNNAYDRQILTVSTSNSIQHTESPNSERDNTSANATRPGVSIRSVAGVELVTATNKVELGLSDQVVEKGEVEVTGDGENVSDTDLDESASEVATQSRLGCVDHGG